MKVYIKPNTSYHSATLYILKLIEKNQNISFSFVESSEKANIIWDHTVPSSEFIYLDFYDGLQGERYNFNHNHIFRTSPTVTDKNEKKDSIATIFYMINCLQELNPNEESLDQFGRFKYEASFQAKFNSIEENLVQQEIDLFCKKHRLKGTIKRSAFFVSHDIDTIYGSFLQDGFWALKKLKIGVILNLIIWELSRKPHWKNIDKIIKIDSEYDIHSTFFWLVNKGKGAYNIKNADYNIIKEQKLLDLVEQSGLTSGLHKSCSEMSINQELKKGSFQTNYNRYHFLNFLPHKDWKKISESKLELDCSLGFAEHFGFRNSYGKAFQPFDIDKDEPYNFIEAPLNFMDGTFRKYMKIPTNAITNIIINFYEKNPTNCDFSLLWHNTYFSNYKYNSFLGEYKKILGYIYENKIECVTPNELIKENKIEW